MSANIGVDLKFGEYSLSLAADGKTYDFELPASTDGSDNSVAKFTAVAENAGTKVKISDVATYHVPENATSADAMENVRAAEHPVFSQPCKCKFHQNLVLKYTACECSFENLVLILFPVPCLTIYKAH